MRQQLPIYVLALGAFLAQPGFPQAANNPDKPAAQREAQVEPVPVLAVPAEYEYRSGGRRDPFLNPLPKQETTESGVPVPVVRPPGLRGLLLAEIGLNGVVVSLDPNMTRAVIVGPGRKTYFAGRGDSLFDAIVKEIRPNAVVFTVISPSSRQPTDREVVRSVSTAGENK
jgi:hypothetical protein